MFHWLSRTTERSKRGGDPQGSCDAGVVGAASGILRGARVATALGWRAVDAMAPGDLVLTFDGGLQPVTKITRTPVWSGEAAMPKALWPLHVPAGALGNSADLNLLPRQYVMIESDAGEDIFGDPFSLIQASVLKDVAGVEPVLPDLAQEAVTLHFESDQVIFDQSGVLYHCPSTAGLTGMISPTYQALSAADAETLLDCIEKDKAQRRLWDAEDVPGSFVAA